MDSWTRYRTSSIELVQGWIELKPGIETTRFPKRVLQTIHKKPGDTRLILPYYNSQMMLARSALPVAELSLIGRISHRDYELLIDIFGKSVKSYHNVNDSNSLRIFARLDS